MKASVRDRPGLLPFLLLALGFLVLFLPLARGPWDAGPPRPTELTPATGRWHSPLQAAGPWTHRSSSFLGLSTSVPTARTNSASV
jgi:hypothetical protein